MVPLGKEPDERLQRACPCPACGIELPLGAVPLRSIVLCARCCATLLWDGAYKLATESEIASLRDEDRARLVALTVAQHANIASRRPAN